jgi:hypothetical protein
MQFAGTAFTPIGKDKEIGRQIRRADTTFILPIPLPSLYLASQFSTFFVEDFTSV